MIAPRADACKRFLRIASAIGHRADEMLEKPLRCVEKVASDEEVLLRNGLT
jgi:hypothetical protein